LSPDSSSILRLDFESESILASGTCEIRSQRRLDWINVGLMVAAWVLAMAAPFQLFLLAYAVLGPLHYFTEISWLHDRGYFLPPGGVRRGWLMLVAATLATLIYGYVMTVLLDRPVAPHYEVGLVYLVLVTAGLARFVRPPYLILTLSVVSLGLILLALQQRIAFVLAYLLVTIVHVLVFTAAFVLYGALKNRSRPGLMSLLVFVACVAGCLFVSVPSLPASAFARDAYRPFETLNLLLLGGAAATSESVFATPAGVAVMRGIAFAYTYHYLNWFSKTAVIGWHQVSTARALGIGIAWVGSIALYLTNYSAGVAVLYGASLLHVLLEFPLNLQTAVGIGGLLPGLVRRSPVSRFE